MMSAKVHSPRAALFISPELRAEASLPALARVGPGCLRARLTLWRQRQRYRRELRRLLRTGPHLVEDAGLSWGEACHESRKPCWRP